MEEFKLKKPKIEPMDDDLTSVTLLPPLAFLQTVKSASVPCSRATSVESPYSGDGETPSQSSDDTKPCGSKSAMEVAKLPPIGVFWDIENCQVPKGRSALAVAQAIRDRFFSGYREAEFLVVCDVTKENARIIQELNDAHVSLMHVAATCKNAADDKLRQCIRKFAELHSSPAAIVLISGDVNFSADLTDLKYKYKYHVILLHNINVSEALILSSNEHYNFLQLMESLPPRGATRNGCVLVTVNITNLPLDKDPCKVKTRLKHLSENSGGRVGHVSSSVCSISFPTLEMALRAQKRMDGEDVFGNKITVSEPVRTDDWPGITARHRRDSARQPVKEEMDQYSRPQRKETNLQYHNVFHPAGKSYTAKPAELSYLDYLDFSPASPNSIDDFAKSTTPFFSNNISHFNFPKIPNIENLKLSNSGQSDQSRCVQKQFFNNAESVAGLMSPSDRSSRSKFTNFFTNQLDSSEMRVNNAGEGGGEKQQQLTYAQVMSEERQAHMKQLNQQQSYPELLQDVEEAYFQPIQAGRGEDTAEPVELHVSGLDPFLDTLITKNLLFNMFKFHVEVLNVAVFCLSDGSVVASVKVLSLQDAQYAISKLQRTQVGNRRISISFRNTTPHQRELLRSQVSQLLSEMPNATVPLFLFRERFKARFLTTVSVSELNRMKDVCTISEDKAGRVIMANTTFTRTRHIQPVNQENEPYCAIHTKKVWSETEPPTLPNVRISLKVLGGNIANLLRAHYGRLPLPSLADCYQAQFGHLPVDPEGVPLEHLVSCIPGVEIVKSQGTFKYLSLTQVLATGDESAVKCVSPMLVGAMSALAKKLVELVQDTPKCVIAFSQFVPSYHRRYGRQCRVSDYGFTKLLDLLESMPHVIQVIGQGSYKMVTLSHKAQVRRFTADLTRVLKQRNNKQLDLAELPEQLATLTERPWDACHYGLCELTDLLDCLPSNTVSIETQPDGHTTIGTAMREQTAEEVALTRQFATEVVELLKTVPSCSLTFNKFVPAYHNYYGRQVRVNSYGFTKLAELFEAIPQTVTLEEDSSRGDKLVVLTQPIQLTVIGDRVARLVTAHGHSVLLSKLERLYEQQYRALLAPEDYGCDSLQQLILKLSNFVKVEPSVQGAVVVHNKAMDPLVLTHRTRHVLHATSKLPVTEFLATYKQLYQHGLDVETLVTKIPQVVKLVKGKSAGDATLQLTQLSVFANEMISLLSDHGGRIALPSFESSYSAKFQRACQPHLYGCSTLSALLSSVPEVISVETHGYYTGERSIVLNSELTIKKASLQDTATGTETRPDKTSYDLWQGKALFPVPPHPSQLPSPPVQFLATQETAVKSEAMSTTEDEDLRDVGRGKSRLAAHFARV